MGWNRIIGHRVAAAASTLLLAACGITVSQGTLPSAPAEAAAPRELLPDQQVQQVLNRFAFGGRPGDADRVRAMGVDRWVALQLTPQRIDDRATDRLLASYEMLQVPTSEIMRTYREAREARRRAQRSPGNATESPSTRDPRSNARNDPPANGRRDPQGEARGNPRSDAPGNARRDPRPTPGNTFALNDQAGREATRRTRKVLTDVQSAKLARAVISERQLQEVMVDFWENHFSIFAGKGQTRLFLAAYDRDAIRPNAMGKFRDLLGAVAKSPAMLFYLDNWRSAADSNSPHLAADGGSGVPAARGPSTPRRRPEPVAAVPPLFSNSRRMPPRAQSPGQPGTPAQSRSPRRNGLNENYGRELMELHTLGVDGGYTQRDVIEVARAFTGWTIDQRTGTFVFRPRIHDAGPKVVLGHRLAAGRGIQDGEEVLDILASSPATARFIARKLVMHFVSDSPPQALVERVAHTYMRTGGDIREMMRTIATSPEFFSRAAYRAKVKTPFELVASSLRAMSAAPDTTPRTAAIVGRLGQPIFGRQTPDGWPDHGDAWMNTGAILNRINFGLALASGRVRGASLDSWPYTRSLTALGREQQVDGVIRTILGGDASPETRNILISGENPMRSKYAEGAGDPMSFVDDELSDGEMSNGQMRNGVRQDGQPTNPHARRLPPRTAASSSTSALAQTLGLALGAPEFQRR